MTYYQETVDKSKFRYEAMTYTRSSIKSRTTAAPVCTFSLSLSLSLSAIQRNEDRSAISMIELACWLARRKKRKIKPRPEEVIRKRRKMIYLLLQHLKRLRM